jgi:hypothetical protein
MSEQKVPIRDFYVRGGFADFTRYGTDEHFSFDEMIGRGYTAAELRDARNLRSHRDWPVPPT